MDRLLEATARAERDHFWFRGFRRFVRPFVERAVKEAEVGAGAARGNAAALDSLRGNHSILAGEVRRYGRRDLRRRLEAAGFTIERATYTNLAILPMVAGVRLLQRIAGHEESHEEISVPPRPINAVLSGLLAAEAAVVRHVDMPIGSSLLVLARKP